MVEPNLSAESSMLTSWIGAISARYQISAESRAGELARLAFTRFGDLAVAQAAYLTALLEGPSSSVPPDDQFPQLEGILRGVEHLMLLDPVDLDRDSLEKEVLPEIDYRAGLVLTTWQLMTVDPAGAYMAWRQSLESGVVRRLPSAPGPLSLAGVPFPAATRKTRGRFLETVVAPVAEALDLFFEARLALDVAQVLLDPDSARRAARGMAVVSQGDLAELVECVEARLPQANVLWVWRTLRQLCNSVDTPAWGVDGAIPLAHAVPLGELVVQLPVDAKDEDFYATLMQLHRRFPHREGLAFRDYVAVRRPSGHRALHTTIAVPGPDGHLLVRAKVRSHPVKEARIDGWHRPQPRPNPEAAVTYFLADGRRLDSGHPRCVLELARRVHNSFVATVRGARARENFYGPLDVPPSGSVLHFERYDTARALPHGWEEAISPGAPQKVRKKERAAIRREARTALRPVLQEAGFRIIEAALLATFGDDLVPPRDELAAIVRTEGLLGQAGLEARVAGVRPTTPEWWFEQVAITEYLARGENVPNTPHLSVSEIEGLLASVKSELLRLAFLELGDPTQGRSHGNLELCPECLAGPQIGRADLDQFALDLTRRPIVVHRLGTPCSSAPTLERWGVAQEHPPYFLVKAQERRRILDDVLAVFREFAEVSCQDVRALVQNGRQAFIRVLTGPLRRERAAEIKRRLERLPSATVWGPEDPQPDEEHRLFAPRRTSTSLPVEPQGDPWETGRAITQGVRFYGRRLELARLNRMLADKSRTGDASLGILDGPLRIGKSSAAHAFLRGLSSAAPSIASRALVTYVEANPGNSYGEFVAELKQRVEAQLYRDGTRRLPISAPGDFVDAFSTSSRFGVVVLDEFGWVLNQACRSGEQRKHLAVMLRKLATTKNVFTVLVGPSPEFDNCSDPQLHWTLEHFGRRVTLGGLERSAFRELLQAKNTTSYLIEYEEGLEHLISSDTERNPYWGVQIASSMLHRSAVTSRLGVRNFTVDLWRETRNRARANIRLFADRYRFAVSDELARVGSDPVMALLYAMASKDTAMTLPAIRTFLEENKLETEGIERKVEALRGWGALEPAPDGHGALKIQSQLLKDHLLFVGQSYAWTAR